MQRRTSSASRLGSLPTVLIPGIGGVLSVVWLFLVIVNTGSDAGWDTLAGSHPADFAIFLAAASAPLAALWLVVGVALLGVALGRMQTAIVETQRQSVRTSGEIEALIRTSIEMQELARRQSFLNGAEMAIKDLNSQAGLIAGRLDILSAQETEYLWALNAAGDPWAFAHALLDRTRRDADFLDLVAHRVAEDDVASAGLQRFLRRYDRLVSLAKQHDTDRLVREVLEDGPMDRLHAIFEQVSAQVQYLLESGAIPPSSHGGPSAGHGWDQNDQADDAMRNSRNANGFGYETHAPAE